MTTPAYPNPISLAHVNAEFGVANLNQAHAGAGFVPPGTTGYFGAIPSSGTISLANFWNSQKIVKAALTGVETPSGTYQAQSGFSVDRWDDGVLRLTIGLWPHDPPHSQHCDWHWLQFGGVQNTARRNSGQTNFWETVNVINLDAIGIGSTYLYKTDNGAYRFVPGTFNITRTAANQIKLALYPDGPWSTGDTGTSISIQAWFNIMVAFGGGTYTQTPAGTDDSGNPIYTETLTNKGQWYLTW